MADIYHFCQVMGSNGIKDSDIKQYSADDIRRIKKFINTGCPWDLIKKHKCPNKLAIIEELHSDGFQWQTFISLGEAIFELLKVKHRGPELYKTFITSSNNKYNKILPKLDLEKRKKIIDNADLCTICLDSFSEKQEISITSCNHVFHSDCIRNTEWAFKCALCRKNDIGFQ